MIGLTALFYFVNIFPCILLPDYKSLCDISLSCSVLNFNNDVQVNDLMQQYLLYLLHSNAAIFLDSLHQPKCNRSFDGKNLPGWNNFCRDLYDLAKNNFLK